MPTPAHPPPTHLVTAVIVARNGQHWLARTTAALAAQQVRPAHIIGVDTSSNDASAALLAELLGPDRVMQVPRRTGFGAAVALALQSDARRHAAAVRGRQALHRPGVSSAGVARPEAGPPEPAVEWIWLLHDDCAPDPEALAKLLRFVERNPGVAVVGPKVRGWYDPRLLLEVGISIARSGRRETGLERREQDQGQHDGVHDTLAVGSAGMLVRRDVWHVLGGFDPRLPLFRDDVDFGWRANLAGYRVVCCTDAVVYHAEAAAHGRRPLAATMGRHQLADRRSAISVLLFNLPLSSLPWALLRIVVGSLLRVVSLVFGKAPRAALDELLALLSVMVRPDRVVRARLARRRTRTRPARSALPLLAGAAANVRHVMESISSVIGTGPAAMVGAGAHRAVETGPGGEAADNLPFWGTVLVRQVIGRPPVVLGLGLLAVTLLAGRHLLFGGHLLGGALLPAPDSAADLWRTYVQAWHPVGVGSDTPAAPYVAVVAAVATVLFGSAGLAVDLLVLGAVPLAGVGMYLALRMAVRSVPLRLWAAAVYALCPPVVGAIAAGRIGTTVLALLLPALAVLIARAVGETGVGGDPRAAWGAGLVLAVVTSFTPVVYVIAICMACVAGIFWTRGRGQRHVLIIVFAPLALLAPWIPAVLADPGVLLREAGLPGPGLADPQLAASQLLLLHPGGPGGYPAFFMVGVVLAAVAALLRADRRAVLVASWVVAIVALVAALLLSRSAVSVPPVRIAAPAWPGPALLVAVAAMLVAAVVGADGARARLARSSFGWRQPVSVGLAALAAAAPVLAGGWWIADDAAGPLDRRDPVLLPAFVAAEGHRPEQPRTLVIATTADGLSYALLRADGPHLGDAEVAPARRGTERLDDVVAALASGRGGEAAVDLLPYGVRFVLLREGAGRGENSPQTRRLLRAIDTIPGLVRIGSSGGSALWKVDLAAARLRLVAPPTRSRSADVGVPLPSGPVGARVDVPASASPRWAVLAENRATGWRATFDGSPLSARTYDGWAQAFVLPETAGTLEIRYEAGFRQVLLWVQVVVLMLGVVLVLPTARTDDLDDGGGGAPEVKRRRQPAPAGP